MPSTNRKEKGKEQDRRLLESLDVIYGPANASDNHISSQHDIARSVDNDDDDDSFAPINFTPIRKSSISNKATQSVPISPSIYTNKTIEKEAATISASSAARTSGGATLPSIVEVQHDSTHSNNSSNAEQASTSQHMQKKSVSPAYRAVKVNVSGDRVAERKVPLPQFVSTEGVLHDDNENKGYDDRLQQPGRQLVHSISDVESSNLGTHATSYFPPNAQPVESLNNLHSGTTTGDGERHIPMVDAVITTPLLKQKRVWAVLVVILVGVVVMLIYTFLFDDTSQNVTIVEHSETELANLEALNELFAATNGVRWFNNDGWYSEEGSSALSSSSDTSDTICMRYGVACSAGIAAVEELFLPGNNLIGDLEAISHNVLPMLTSLKIIDLHLNGLTGDATAISANLASDELKLLERVDLRLTSLTGSISSEWCNKRSETNALLLVDCLIECGCCNHEKLCECIDLRGSDGGPFVDIEGRDCGWYEEDPGRCNILGNENGTYSAQTACCICSGGAFQNPTPSTVPSFAPTSSPTLSSAPTSAAQYLATQLESLMELYESTDGRYRWVDKTGWEDCVSGNSTNFTLCEWTGITCNTADVVTQIDLSYNGLRGTIPSVLGKLTALTSIRMINNDISGTLPSELGQLTNLKQIWLHSNTIAGIIPSEIGQMGDLELMQIRSNLLTGVLQSELGHLTKLAYFDIRYNAIAGTLPSELGLMQSCELFYAQNNGFTGYVPSEIGLMTSMKSMGMHSNDFTGMLPSEVGQMWNMNWLVLSSNNLSGPLPSELGKMESLRTFYVQDNNFTGEMPSEVCALRNVSLDALAADCSEEVICDCCDYCL